MNLQIEDLTAAKTLKGSDKNCSPLDQSGRRTVGNGAHAKVIPALERIGPPLLYAGTKSQFSPISLRKTVPWLEGLKIRPPSSTEAITMKVCGAGGLIGYRAP
jgi:hypothetical protein